VTAAAGAGNPARLEERAPEDLRRHPQTAEVPQLCADAFQALRANIAANGLLTPLKVTEAGVVLDGHARLQAARELGLAMLAVLPVAPEDELGYMLNAALMRRQLSASQRAALAVKLSDLDQLRARGASRQRANLRRGPEVASLPARDAEDEAIAGRVREQIAERAGTSARTVQDVLTVQEHDLEQFDRILNGQVKASTAASRIRRAQRDALIPAPPPLPAGPFELILADPPWTYGSPDSPYSPEQHYPTLSTGEIKSLSVPAAENCLLFLWAVNSLLDEALEVLRTWGFEYRNNMVWVKTDGIGPGVWLRQRHELLLIATRGSVAPPDPQQRVDSVIEAPRTRHSEKPPHAQQRIEAMYPHFSKLELFARTTRPGWTSWGNQATPQPDPNPPSDLGGQ
jgi:N6-adenosine-specific RNA methylase IME4/ParB-like chromosome segregation protein Spo0J